MSNIGLDVKDNVQAVFDIKFPDKTDLRYVNFDDAEFAQDMINTCIVDKRDVKDLKCYKAAIESTIDTIKNQALEENILIILFAVLSKYFSSTELCLFSVE